MDKNITLRKRVEAPVWGHDCTFSDMAHRIFRAAMSPQEWLRQYYSTVLGHEVPAGQALRYTHAQLAFCLAVFPSYSSLAAHAVAALWFGVALVLCSKRIKP